MNSATRMFAAAALAGVLLTGCTANTAPAPSRPDATDPNNQAATDSAQAAPATRGNVEPVITGVWASEKYDQFLKSAGRIYSGDCGDASTPAGLRACAPFEPFAYVSAVSSTGPGDLVVTVTPEAWGGGPYDPEQFFTLEYVARGMSVDIAHHDDDLDTLTVTTPDGSHSFTQEREPYYATYYPAGS